MSKRAILALADGRTFSGLAFGHLGRTAGEICFNTSMTGYQEILTDPSYADQIITFTCPHIGNVGVNDEDMESTGVVARGLVVRQPARICSNYRASGGLEGWLKSRKVVGIAGIDTRALTRHLRSRGALNGAIVSDGGTEEEALAMATACPGLAGRNLVAEVSCARTTGWTQGTYRLHDERYGEGSGAWHVVALDFGCKRNILRMLVDCNCRVSVVPWATPPRDILALNPDGIFLSNGPGDPSAVSEAVAHIRELVEADIPVFGICMGHQLLSQALGLKTFKLKFGHRGGNHPVRDEVTGRVEITSQNHGFAVCDTDIPAHVEVTHRSLFDGTIEGLRLRDRPVLSVQYHPEASPGPHDASGLFARFVELIKEHRG